MSAPLLYAFVCVNLWLILCTFFSAARRLCGSILCVRRPDVRIIPEPLAEIHGPIEAPGQNQMRQKNPEAFATGLNRSQLKSEPLTAAGTLVYCEPNNYLFGNHDFSFTGHDIARSCEVKNNQALSENVSRGEAQRILAWGWKRRRAVLERKYTSIAREAFSDRA